MKSERPAFIVLVLFLLAIVLLAISLHGFNPVSTVPHNPLPPSASIPGITATP
jgi:hypothetical protein